MLTAIHVTVLITTLGAVLFADHEAFDYLRGKKQTLSHRRLNITHWLVWAGLAGMIITGIFLFLPRQTYLLSNPAFYFKMVFVGFLVVNATIIGELMPIATKHPFSQLSRRERNTLVASGAISFLSWTAAVIFGLIIS